MEAQVEVAQTGMSVGQDCFGMSGVKRVEQQKKKGVRMQRTKETLQPLSGDFETFTMMNVKHWVAHRPRIEQIIRWNKERKEPNKVVLPDLSIAIRTYIKLGIFRTAFVMEERSCLSCGTDRRLHEAYFPRAQSGGRPPDEPGGCRAEEGHN